MKFLKRLFVLALVLAAIYLVLALFGPKNYKVERSRIMTADKEAIWEQVSSFENWPNWSPWQEKDPTVKNKFTGEMGEVGARMSWVGDEELSGTGNMEITEISPISSFNYTLKFEVPFEMQSNGGMTLSNEEGKVKVTWYDEGDISFLMRPMMMFMDLDGQIGPDFERGLEKIDSVANSSLPSDN